MANNKPRRTQAYYWPKHGFYTRAADGEWINTDKETLRMKLIRAGFASEKDAQRLSPASNAMLDVIEKNNVRYAGPLAGHTAGMKDLCGFRVLVTSSPKVIEPSRGKLPLWQEIIETQFGEAQGYYLTWLKAAWQRVRAGGGPMLPALILAGKPDVAKSLSQNHLITPLLGGRMAKPWRYWTGETTFNEDLCGAEHLMLEDEVGVVKQEKKRLFGDGLKAAVANETTSLHPKGDKAITTKCVWAITASTNLEPQNLRTFPLHDGTLSDKLMVLMVRERPGCLPAPDDYAGFIKFTARLHAELPALAAFLHKYEPEEKFRGKQRSLVAPWREPEIMELVSEDDAAPKLLWLIDEFRLLEVELPSGAKTLQARSLTSMELERELASAKTNGQAERLLGRMSMGYLLREVAKRFPARVEKDGDAHNHITKWIIRPEA